MPIIIMILLIMILIIMTLIIMTIITIIISVLGLFFCICFLSSAALGWNQATMERGWPWNREFGAGLGLVMARGWEIQPWMVGMLHLHSPSLQDMG